MVAKKKGRLSYLDPTAPAPVGAFFWAVADGGINFDRAGGVSAPRSRPRKPLPYVRLRRGLSLTAFKVVSDTFLAKLERRPCGCLVWSGQGQSPWQSPRNANFGNGPPQIGAHSSDSGSRSWPRWPSCFTYDKPNPMYGGQIDQEPTAG